MADLGIMLGRCSFCGAPASRSSRLVGSPSGTDRICRTCVSSSFGSPPSREDDRLHDLELAVAKDGDIRARLELGEIHLGRGDSRKAANHFLAVGESFERDGFALKAVAVYKKVLEIDPERIEVRMRLGDVYRKLSIPADAVEHYEEAAKRFEEHGLVESAVAALRRALELEPERVDARMRLARLVPTDGANVRRLAEIHLANGEASRAARLLVGFCHSNRHDTAALAVLAKALDGAAPDRAAAARREIARIESGEGPSASFPIEPPEPDASIRVSDVLSDFRREVDARIGRENLQARLDLGIAYEEMGLYEEAIAEFRIASADPALHADAHALIALCQREMGRIDEAIRSVSEAIKTTGIGNAKKAAYFLELSRLMALKGDEKKAYKSYQQALVLDPTTRRGHPGSSDPLSDLKGAREAFAGGGSRDAFRPTRGEVPERLDEEEGVADLERRLRADPEDADSRSRLASLLSGSRIEEARLHYRIAADQYRREGNSPKARICEERIAKLPAPQTTPPLLICGFCGNSTDHLRPPVTNASAVICADCLQTAFEILVSS